MLARQPDIARLIALLPLGAQDRRVRFEQQTFEREVAYELLFLR
jgi:hypothetical protein